MPVGILKQIEEQTSKTDDDEKQTLLHLKPENPELNAVFMLGPADFLPDLTERLNSIDLKQEQSLDEVIKRVIFGKKITLLTMSSTHHLHSKSTVSSSLD